MAQPTLKTSIDLHRIRVLDTLVDNLEAMAYRCRPDEHWTMLFVSQGCRNLTGYTPEDLVENHVVSWNDITLDEDKTSVRENIQTSLKNDNRYSVQYRIKTKRGAVKWVNERGAAVRDELGNEVIEGFVEDFSAFHDSIEALQQAETRYRHIFDYATEGMFQTSEDGHYLNANPALARMYGYENPALLIAGLSNIQHQLYVEEHRREKFRKIMAANDEVINFESEIFRRDGSTIWISENSHTVRDASGKLLWYEGTVEDITERRRYQEQLEIQANHDRLTGLPNRNLLSDRLEQGISHAQRLSYFLAVVFIDLDNFKFINDSLGHLAGDKLLVEISSRLKHCLRPSDTVARQGGDEFVLVLNDHYRVNTVISLLERVLIEIIQPVEIAGRELQIGASMGVALYPQDGTDVESLLRHADTAMYAAKSRGKNNFQFFTHELNQIADERLNVEAAMRKGLENDEFDVHFQAKVNHSGKIVGAEALARWTSPELGVVSPDRFIPVAEEAGMIVALTDTILRKAFTAAKAWLLPANHEMRVAVNLSPKLFLIKDYVTRFKDILESTQLPADRVEVEITEGVFLGDGEAAVRILKDLKMLGVSLAMDDFGTGYSSLSYLRRFPLDTIKIDRSLVTGIEHEAEVAMIARAVISLGQSLRKTVVAEGVENQAQCDFLRVQGCDEFQGFLMAKPMSTSAFAKTLETGNGYMTW